MTTTQRVPVLIVGGGGADLTASMLLSSHGVETLDPRLAFLRVRALGRAGAVLVRPDRVIAWRSMGAVADPGRTLGAALDRVLERAS